MGKFQHMLIKLDFSDCLLQPECGKYPYLQHMVPKNGFYIARGVTCVNNHSQALKQHMTFTKTIQNTAQRKLSSHSANCLTDLQQNPKQPTAHS